MLVPKFLFGNAREVKSSVGRAITAFKRGAGLQDVAEASGYVDLRELADSWVWLDRAWSMRSVAARDYRAVMLTNALFDNRHVPFEKSNELREMWVDDLSRSAWGTVLLNSGQTHPWQVALPWRPLRPSRRAYVATISGTLEHWDVLIRLGARFYSGGASAREFPQALPAYGGLLAKLGLEVRGESTASAWRDIRELCGDGPPELLPENLTEVARLCGEGVRARVTNGASGSTASSPTMRGIARSSRRCGPNT